MSEDINIKLILDKINDTNRNLVDMMLVRDKNLLDKIINIESIFGDYGKRIIELEKFKDHVKSLEKKREEDNKKHKANMALMCTLVGTVIICSGIIAEHLYHDPSPEQAAVIANQSKNIDKRDSTIYTLESVKGVKR